MVGSGMLGSPWARAQATRSCQICAGVSPCAWETWAHAAAAPIERAMTTVGRRRFKFITRPSVWVPVAASDHLPKGTSGPDVGGELLPLQGDDGPQTRA